jgi:methylmalonyl-CoA mutase N-terminal domain/subunit
MGIETEKEFTKWIDNVYKKWIDKNPERFKKFKSLSDIEIEPLYTPLTIKNIDYIKDIGFPGMYPFTRGIYPSMYRGRIWTMREFSGFGTAEDTNKRYHYLLKNGQTGLSIAFHLPTIMGYDSDHPKSRGEVGKCGVTVDSLKDMEIIFRGIPLNKITTSMTINAPASILLAMYIGVAKKQGVSLNDIGGTIQNDILKEYIAQKSWIFPPEPSIRLITDVFEFCSKHVPRWNTISISGYHIREAGSTAVQELAFTIADGIEYVKSGIEAGLRVDDFAPRLSFFFGAHNDLFEEVAKFRAGRRMWARLMKERFKAKKLNSMMFRFHTQTAGCALTKEQPMNNIIRVAIHALSAILGGTQSLHTNSMDEVFALPTEEAVKIALRTQQILAHESGVADTIDPLAGSYFIEALTDKMESLAMDYIEKIDKMGGMVKAIELGYPQREIGEASYRYQREIENKERIIVGVNEYVEGEEKDIEILNISEEVEKKQMEFLKELRRTRNNRGVIETLKNLENAAKGENNLMPYIIDAVMEYATIGEICDVLRGVFGEYKESIEF